MLNNKYYVGFEGYPQITLTDGNKENLLEIWIGYFETILDCMLEQGMEANGILPEYVALEGWYEDELWEIKDINATLNLFLKIDTQLLATDVSPEIARLLPEVIEEIVTFLKGIEEIKGKAYVLYS